MFQGSAFLILTEDAPSATALRTALQTRLTAAGRPVPIHTPGVSSQVLRDPSGQEWLRRWWQTHGSGIPLSGTVLVALDGPEGSVQVGPVDHTQDFLVAGVDELADAVAGYALATNLTLDGTEDTPEDDADSGRRRSFLPAALVTGALVAGGWLVSAAFHPDSAAAQTLHHHQPGTAPAATQHRATQPRATPQRTRQHATVPRRTTPHLTTYPLTLHSTHRQVTRQAYRPSTQPRLSRSVLNALSPAHASRTTAATRSAWTPQRTFSWSHALRNELHSAPSHADRVVSPGPVSTPTYDTTPVVDFSTLADRPHAVPTATGGSDTATPDASSLINAATGGSNAVPTTTADTPTSDAVPTESSYAVPTATPDAWPTSTDSGTTPSTADLATPDTTMSDLATPDTSRTVLASQMVPLTGSAATQATTSALGDTPNPPPDPNPIPHSDSEFFPNTNVPPGKSLSESGSAYLKNTLGIKGTITTGKDPNGNGLDSIGFDLAPGEPGVHIDKPSLIDNPKAGTVLDLGGEKKVMGYAGKAGVNFTDPLDAGHWMGGVYGQYTTPDGSGRKIQLTKDANGWHFDTPSINTRTVPDYSTSDFKWTKSFRDNMVFNKDGMEGFPIPLAVLKTDGADQNTPIDHTIGLGPIGRLELDKDGHIIGGGDTASVYLDELRQAMKNDPTLRAEVTNTAGGLFGGAVQGLNGGENFVNDVWNGQGRDAMRDLGTGADGAFSTAADGIGSALAAGGHDELGHLVYYTGHGLGDGFQTQENGYGDAISDAANGNISDAIRDAGDGTGNGMMQMSDGLGRGLQAVGWDSAGNAVTDFGRGTGNGMVDATGGFGNAASDLGTGFTDAWGNVQNGLDAAGNDWNNGNYGNIGSDLGAAYDAGSANLYSGTGNAITDGSGGIGDALGSVGRGAGGAISDFGAPAAGAAVGDAYTGLGNGFGAFGSGMGGAVSDLGTDSYGDAVSNLGSGTGGAISATADGFGNAATDLGATSLGNAIGDAGNGYGGAVTSMGTGVGDSMNSLGNGDISGAVTNLGTGASNAMSSTTSGTASGLSDLGANNAANAVSSIGNGVAGGIGDMTGGVSSGISSIGTGFGAAGSSLSSGADAAGSSLSTGFGAAGSSLSSGMDAAGSSLSTGMDAAGSSLNSGIGSASTNASAGDYSGALGSATDGVTGAAGAMGTGIAGAADSASAGITGAAGAVGDGITGAADSVGSSVAGAADSVGSGISGAADAVGSGISGAADSVGSGISGAASSVGDAVGGMF